MYLKLAIVSALAASVAAKDNIRKTRNLNTGYGGTDYVVSTPKPSKKPSTNKPTNKPTNAPIEYIENPTLSPTLSPVKTWNSEYDSTLISTLSLFRF
jgi:hypothetical protein